MKIRKNDIARILMVLILFVVTPIFAAWLIPEQQPADFMEAEKTYKRSSQMPGEDPMEDRLIEAALLEQGYYREDVPLDDLIQDVLQTKCREHGIPYHIALGLIYVESRFDPEAVSAAGCYGLCQLNPEYFPSGLTPAQNVATGMDYLAYQIKRYDGDLEAALTAYNAGHDTGNRAYANAVMEAAEEWREQN